MTRYTPLWLQAGSYPASVDRRLIAAVFPNPVATGCAVTVATAMNVNVAPGSVVVPTANNTGSVLCVSDAVEVVTLATAPASGTNRIDLVCCSVLSTDIGTAAGDTFSFVAVTGSSGTSPPAVPAGMVALAQVLVIGGAANLSAGNITDRRSQMYARDTLHARVSRSAVWTIPYPGPAPVPYDTIERDPTGLYSIANGYFTVPVGGIWQVTASGYATPPGGGTSLGMSLYQNGVNKGGVNGQSGYALSIILNLINILRCNAGDKLTVLMSAYPAAMTSTYPDPSTTFANLDYLGTG